MSQSGYPAAGLVAPRVESYFGQQMGAARQNGVEAGPAPNAAVVEALIEAAFWASLRREEGYSPRISLALVEPDPTGASLTLERQLPLTPAVLARLAPAVEQPGIHLGVWRTGDGLRIWGATRTIPAVCLVLEVAGPGLLVVKHGRRDSLGKFVNVAVLEGDRVKIVDERASKLPDCQAKSPEAWEALRLGIEGIAGLTAVDGATILTDRLELVAFGAKIVRRRGNPQVDRVAVTEPIEGVAPAVVHPSELGGTRHLSAAQFVQDQRDALALVASQDGRFTVFAWSACQDIVHAHRVESLLL